MSGQITETITETIATTENKSTITQSNYHRINHRKYRNRKTPILTANTPLIPLEQPRLINCSHFREYETKSDSFYFVNDELVMHNKAEYAYRV